MSFLTTIFLIPAQNRLRLIWRLGLFSLLLVILLLLVLTAEILLEEALPGLGSSQVELLSILLAGMAFTAAAYLSARFFDKRRFQDLGLKLSPPWWSDFIFGLGLGAGLMALIFLVQLSLGWIKISFPHTPNPIAALPTLGAAILYYSSVGFYEELFNRGYLIKNLAEGFNGKRLSSRWAVSLAALLTSIFFGLIHVGNPNATSFAVLNIILAGLVLAAGYLLTGQLALSIGFHIAWNFIQGPVLGFPVSGSTFLSGALFQVEQLGPSLWTGGPFGPEGGLMGVLALLLGLGMIWYWKWDDDQGIDPGIARYQPRTPKSTKNGIIQE